MLEIQNVTKKFGKFTVLENLSLEFTNGVYGLLAPNGAGKTTLIKMLVTLIFPTQGDIRYEGIDIYSMGEKYRDRIGYLPQQFGYYKNDSPQKYLRYLSALKGLDQREADQKIDEVLKLVALEDVKKKKMKKFSGGMIQRVGIAQALLNDPELLILDEPTAGLDPKERARFRNLLSRLSRDRIIILSTHIVADVEAIANEIMMIKDRRLLYKDTIEAVCHTLEGQVYETEIAFEEMETFREQYHVLGEKQTGGKVTVRFQHSAGSPGPSWMKVAPQLEDVFLTVYQDEQA